MEVRLCLPVALVEDPKELRTILRSPDAEKLCPFTAAEIKKQEEEGINVVDEISVEMDNTEVICFVKHYDKPYGHEVVRRYVLLKLYTGEELNTYNNQTSEPVNKDGQLQPISPEVSIDSAITLPPSADVPPAADKQFFSPKTKDVLSQIEKDSYDMPAASTQHHAAKRPIHFGSLTDEDMGTAEINASEECQATQTKTPKKKTKPIN